MYKSGISCCARFNRIDCYPAYPGRLGLVQPDKLRYYRIIGAGTMRLIESDMKATGGKFYMLKDAINTQVAGQPAISKIFRDEGGRIIEEVLWVSEQKLHMLTFAPDMEPGRYGLTKSNFRLSAVSLAQELR
jgi:hypothetical protein